MALKEDDIKDLGLDIGEENVPQAVGCYACEKGQKCVDVCQDSCLYKCMGCQTGCEVCENCQGNWQCAGCQKTRECKRCEDYQCGSCENTSQCGSCESYQCGTCENTSQCGYCQSNCEDAAQKNSAPNAPSSISVPSNVRGGETIAITWGAATDPDGNLTGYILEKKTDNADFVQIYKGASRSFSDTIIAGTNTAQYRVKSYDSYGKESSYKMSSIITVTNNSAPEISGKDEDLGGKKTPFKINLSVADKDGDTVNVVCKLNGSIVKTINNIRLDSSYEIEIDAVRFNALALNARNEIEISATDSKATSYRRYTFARVNSAPEIVLDKTIYGEQDKPFSFSYKITDAEGDKCSVRILYGSRVLEYKKEVILNTEQTYKFGKLDFVKIPAGEISIKIEATDANGGVSSKIVTFKKTINGCGYIFKKDTAKNATQAIVSVSRKIDEKSTFKVYVCNNANDANPAWVEVTDMLEKIYTIKNTSKTASKWAFGLKVEVIRGKDAGDSYLNAIGYSYR